MDELPQDPDSTATPLAGTVSPTDSKRYRYVILVVTGLLTFISLLLAYVIYSTNDTAAVNDVIKLIISGTFEVLKQLLMQ